MTRRKIEHTSRVEIEQCHDMIRSFRIQRQEAIENRQTDRAQHFDGCISDVEKAMAGVYRKSQIPMNLNYCFDDRWMDEDQRALVVCFWEDFFKTKARPWAQSTRDKFLIDLFRQGHEAGLYALNQWIDMGCSNRSNPPNEKWVLAVACNKASDLRKNSTNRMQPGY